jgi:hypothetical protein
MSMHQLTWKLIVTALSVSVVVAPDWMATVGAVSPAVSMFEPPPGRDAPRGGTAGGGTRPVGRACLVNPSAKSGSLTALSPGHHLGLTQRNRPNLIVYVPQTTAQMAEFSLFDQQMNGIYQVSIPITQTGLISIPFPDAAPSLTQNQPYYWTLALACNPTDRTEDLVVGGWIEQAEPSNSLKQHLAQAGTLEQISLYAQQGFWYDALNTLIELERTQPNNPELARTWAQLLQSVGLDAISLTVPKAKLVTYKHQG